jgi:hypothetical protein
VSLNATNTPTRWQKSSRTGGGQGGQCVEIARIKQSTAIRDSKNITGGILIFQSGGFEALTTSLKRID